MGKQTSSLDYWFSILTFSSEFLFLYNTSKITFPHFIPPLKGRLGGGCKQVGGQARLPCYLVTWIKRDQQQR